MINPNTKPPNLAGRGLRYQRLKCFNAPIIKHFRAKSQALPTKNDRLTNLIGKVRDKRLTESLELLEKSGFTGDLALFILGEIAACGVCDA
ncbi:hypothetical protein [Anabaena sp. UHCC 0204]|uniref:hypothetical protein n=1 Tax=Anabaena sp. UHCC 0204 TaxID=2590009 RepID=UPI001447F218|nr:hypothetical protein [Anabaena sp. UHCC 0204]MTJ10697.1 hypothetical protein [Anabaena sp. UHCC 0204]